jgi:hypothetical protein
VQDQGSKDGFSRRVMLQALSATSVAYVTAGSAMAQPGSRAARGGKAWWEEDYRIIQTNNAETDVLQNPRDIAKAVKDFGGTAIVSNIGVSVPESVHEDGFLQGDDRGLPRRRPGVSRPFRHVEGHEEGL